MKVSLVGFIAVLSSFGSLAAAQSMPSGITVTLVNDQSANGGSGVIESGSTYAAAEILCWSPGQYNLIGNEDFTWNSTSTASFDGYTVTTYAAYPPYPNTSAFANPATVNFQYTG